MILYSKEAKVNDSQYNLIPVLKPRNNITEFSIQNIRKHQIAYLKEPRKEATENNFKVLINDKNLQDIDI
jgi:hypothetical protein